MAERTYTRRQVLEIVKKAKLDLINEIHDPNNPANKILEAKRKEWREAEITKRVKEALTTERQAYKEKLDGLTANTNDLKGLIGSTKASYDAMMLKLENMKEFEGNFAKITDTFIKLTANLSGLTTSLDKIVGLVEGKSKTDRDVVA